MVRIATEKDAEQLEILNNEFNGEGETTLENIRLSLADNKQEVIVCIVGLKPSPFRRNL